MSTDHERRERIDAVADAEGTEDDLLTVAVPPDGSVRDVLERVEEAHAEAEYIDADGSSKPRRAVLDRVQQRLHEYEETPENGLVLYAGSLASEDDSVEYVFDDLPNPVAEAHYEWDNEFDASALEVATDASDFYGLLVVERGGAVLGTLDGERVTVEETIDSDVPGKTRAGGQSADRFERERERQTEAFFEDVAAAAERMFLDGDEPAVDGLLVGGTTVTVDEFVHGGYLDHRLADLTVGGTFAVEYASERGLQRLAEKGRDAVDDAEGAGVRETIEEFREALHDDGDVVYGAEAVEKALEYEAVETTLVSGDRPVEELREYEERTAEEGGEVVVVPPETEAGARFDETFGVAALLRFPIE